MKKLFLALFLGLFLNFSLSAKALAAVSFSLSPATQQVNNGDTFQVNIVLDTGTSEAVGAAALINFDNAKLEATNLSAGAVFSQPLAQTINQTSGTINLDYGTLQSPFKGSGAFGTITFKAKNTGTAGVTFVFVPSATKNTSIVASSAGQNILTTVNNGSYTIVTAGGSATPTPTPAPAASPAPATANLTPTFGLLLMGFVFVLFGGLSLLAL